jgi:hypothetical protein
MINYINGLVMNTTTETIVRAYTVKELAALYGISEKTFKGWLQPHADVIGKKKPLYQLRK